MKIVIMKTGDTFEDLKESKGDFEDWFVNSMGMDRSDCQIVDLPRAQSLPPLEDVNGLIITGSHDMVTDRLEWNEKALPWIREAVTQKIPSLGICFGHQLLAHAMGGQVGDNPRGREFGTVKVTLTEDGQRDSLFSNLPGTLEVQACHKQSVLTLPSHAIALAWNEWDQNHAFVIGDCAWGLQFHPEFDAEIMKQYIRYLRDPLIEEGQNPDQLIADCHETPIGPVIMKNFVSIVLGEK